MCYVGFAYVAVFILWQAYSLNKSVSACDGELVTCWLMAYIARDRLLLLLEADIKSFMHLVCHLKSLDIGMLLLHQIHGRPNQHMS